MSTDTATSKTPSRNPGVMIAVCTGVAAVVFAGLWLNERAQQPVEVVKEVEKRIEVPIEKRVEVPVEKIREVPKEVIREVVKEVEVPAKLTESQLQAIEIGERFISAQFLRSDRLFDQMDSMSVSVFVDDEVKGIVSEDTARNKFELTLRRHGISIDPKSLFTLSIRVEGFLNGNQTQFTYTVAGSVAEITTVVRKGQFHRIFAEIWRDGSYGVVGKLRAEQAVLGATERLAESFANKYLASRDREKKSERPALDLKPAE